ncbi:MAG: hypothetical protein NXY59_02825 [Aigarchaeota archaeon]|nr:hypothetical protein [Candidatus Pelearchaeum maunauluense]
MRLDVGIVEVVPMSGKRGERVGERVQRFKELIKQGYRVREALKESGLSGQQYKKHDHEIWSDPEMESYKPEPVMQRTEELNDSDSVEKEVLWPVRMEFLRSN